MTILALGTLCWRPPIPIFAPWYIVRSDDKKRARLNVLSHFLSLIPYEAPKRDKIKLPTRDNKNAYDDESTIKDRRWIEEKF